MDSISKKYNKQKIILGLILTVLATLSLILSSKTTYASTYVMDKAGVLNQQTVEEITQTMLKNRHKSIILVEKVGIMEFYSL